MRSDGAHGHDDDLPDGWIYFQVEVSFEGGTLVVDDGPRLHGPKCAAAILRASAEQTETAS